MTLTLMAAKLIRRFRLVGFRRSVHDIASYLSRPTAARNDFDDSNGTDTGGTVPLWSYTIKSSNAVFGGSYQATDEVALKTVLSLLPLSPQDYTFIDLGCGKGRALIVAQRYGFSQVIGLEFAKELIDVAYDNIKLLGLNNVTLIHDDAAMFAKFSSRMVVYMFNPFSAEVMAQVLRNLVNSQSRECYIVYGNPEHRKLLDDCPNLARLPIAVSSARYHILAWTLKTN